MDENQERQIREIAEALSRAEESPWQPTIVRRSILAHPVRLGPYQLHPVTLGGWLRLEEQRSPYLSGEWPQENGAILACLARTVSVLCRRDIAATELNGALSEEQLVWALGADGPIRRVIREAMEPAIEMRSPLAEQFPGLGQHAHRDGFGWWLPLYTRMRGEYGMSREEALGTTVAEAWLLKTCGQALDGFEPKGLGYAGDEAISALKD